MPLLALTAPVPQAAAIMLPMLMVMDVTGLQQPWRERERFLFPPKREGSVAPLWIGRTCATVSGFTSIVAHAGGPPINAHLLPQ